MDPRQLTTGKLLDLVTALGFELTRRGQHVEEIQALRRYYVAVRRGEAKGPGFAFAVVPGNIWSAVRVLERLGSLGMAAATVPPFQSSRATKRGQR